jgi:hypothetical protein
MRFESIDPGSARASRADRGALAAISSMKLCNESSAVFRRPFVCPARAPDSAREARALPGRSALRRPLLPLRLGASQRDVPTRRTAPNPIQ